MYEDKTIETINAKMLANINDEYEKTPGFPTADLTKSFAIESSNLWAGLQTLFNKLNVDTLAGDELTKYVLQRKGIIRKEATFAKGIVTVIGNGSIKIGDLFSTKNNVQFKSLVNLAVIATADVKVEAVIAGNVGNVGVGSIVQFPITIQGIVSCNNTAPTYDGFEVESDDLLRERYYEALQIPATSGNKFHYVRWAKEVVGVGDAKVLSLWNGANTVKVIIINSDKQPASVDIIKKTQDYIDPNISGTGAGEAPIGAYCTVVSATANTINVNVDVIELPNFSIADVTKNIKENITKYLQEIAFNQDFVSFAKVGSIIFSTTGVKDYTTLKINNGDTNIIIANGEVAILGVVTVV